MARKNDSKTQEKKVLVEQELAALSAISDEELYAKLSSSEEGLNQVEASDRLEEYGRNIIDTGSSNGLAMRIRDAIINPFNVVLLIVSIVTLITDVIIADEPSWATLLIGFTKIAGFFDLPVMIPSFAIWLLVLMAAYMILAQILKAIYIRINKEWV